MQGQSPPKTGPEIQPAENHDIHPSAGWSPPTLSSVLALRGGQNLVGGISHPSCVTPPPPLLRQRQDPAAPWVAQRGVAHAHLHHPLLPECQDNGVGVLGKANPKEIKEPQSNQKNPKRDQKNPKATNKPQSNQKKKPQKRRKKHEGKEQMDSRKDRGGQSNITRGGRDEGSTGKM